MKSLGENNEKYVKRMNYMNYHDDKIVIACNNWKILQAACKTFIKSINCLLHSDFVCCMQFFWENSLQRSNYHVMYHVKLVKSFTQLTETWKTSMQARLGLPYQNRLIIVCHNEQSMTPC